MTLEGQREAFTFNWIDRSSAEVARPPAAGISSAAGIISIPCLAICACSRSTPSAAAWDEFTGSQAGSFSAAQQPNGSGWSLSRRDASHSERRLTGSGPGAGRSQAGFGFIDLRCDEVRQNYRPVAPAQQQPAAEEPASYLLPAPEGEVCTYTQLAWLIAHKRGARAWLCGQLRFTWRASCQCRLTISCKEEAEGRAVGGCKLKLQLSGLCSPVCWAAD